MTDSAPHVQSDPTRTSSAASIVRSEEQAHVRTVSTPRSRLRIQKVIVTEERTITVQVRREELRVTEYPASDILADATGNASTAPVTTHDADFDLVLSEEQIEIHTRIVPVERVRVTRTPVVIPTEVTVTLRQEQADIDHRQH